MKTWAVLLSPVLLTSYAFAHDLNETTPLQYDYAYGSVGSGSYKDHTTSGDNTSSLVVGISHKFEGSNWLWSADYGSRFNHLDPQTVDQYQLRTGVGYRWLLMDNLDLVSNGKIGALRVDAGKKETDFVYSVDIGLRYAFTKKLEAAATTEAIRNKWMDVYVYTLSGDYYLYPKFALGAFMSYRDGEHGASVREAGLLARFNY